MSMMILFICALLIMAGSGFFWYKECRDEDSVKIYRSFFCGAFVLAAGTGVSLLPEYLLGRYGHWWYFFLGIILIIDLTKIMKECRRKDKLKKNIPGIIIMAAILIFCIYSFAKPMIQSALQAADTGGLQEVNDHAEAAKDYAQQLVLEDCGITENDIHGVNYSWVTEIPEDSGFYVGFSYRLPGEDIDRSYGYRIAVDDEHNCRVMDKGEELGKKLISTYEVPEGEGTQPLTMEAVKELSLKGASLSWEDFGAYDGYDIGSGLYVLKYDIDDDFFLLIGGADMDEKPEYIRLVRSTDETDYIDIRKEDVEDFIKGR